MPTPTFAPYELGDAAEALRPEVRAFLETELAGRPEALRARSWMAEARDFSRKLGERGWLGMTWPKTYGGGERSQGERYVVIEELLAAGAPVASHWSGDRQVGPMLLRFGSEELKQRFLPRMARGELSFCLGMSEPDAGSDLAAVRTRATPVVGGWSVSGQKIWTSGAHGADYMVALVRTRDAEPKHAGLSQMLIDMKSDGVSVRPIETMNGEHHFNEVFLDEVFVPGEMLVGTEGEGWRQVSAELAFERSGPERYLSSIAALRQFMRAVGDSPSEAEAMLIGAMTAELWTLRQMSLSISGRLAAGESPAVPAAYVKDLGTTLEQSMPTRVQALAGESADADLRDTLAYLLCSAPSFSLRGGTREILRGIIAKELGVR